MRFAVEKKDKNTVFSIPWSRFFDKRIPRHEKRGGENSSIENKTFLPEQN